MKPFKKIAPADSGRRMGKALFAKPSYAYLERHDARLAIRDGPDSGRCRRYGKTDAFDPQQTSTRLRV
jgi:hypothetical protein